VAGRAEGLKFSRPLPMVKPPASEPTPPSVFVMTTLYVPAVAAVPFTEFVGVTLKTMELADTEVTDDVNDVPFTVETSATVAPVANPLPAIVTVVGAEASQRVAGLIELGSGAASIVAATVLEAVDELSSVRVTVQVPAADPESE